MLSKSKTHSQTRSHTHSLIPTLGATTPLTQFRTPPHIALPHFRSLSQLHKLQNQIKRVISQISTYKLFTVVIVTVAAAYATVARCYCCCCCCCFSCCKLLLLPAWCGSIVWWLLLVFVVAVVAVVIVAIVGCSAKFINHKLLDYISSQQFRNLLTSRYQPSTHTHILRCIYIYTFQIHLYELVRIFVCTFHLISMSTCRFVAIINRNLGNNNKKLTLKLALLVL